MGWCQSLMTASCMGIGPLFDGARLFTAMKHFSRKGIAIIKP